MHRMEKMFLSKRPWKEVEKTRAKPRDPRLGSAVEAWRGIATFQKNGERRKKFPRINKAKGKGRKSEAEKRDRERFLLLPKREAHGREQDVPRGLVSG